MRFSPEDQTVKSLGLMGLTVLVPSAQIRNGSSKAAMVTIEEHMFLQVLANLMPHFITCKIGLTTNTCIEFLELD